MRFYNLLNELTDKEVKKTLSSYNKRKIQLNFGQLFKDERTIIKKMKLDNELLKKQYDLLLSNNKSTINNIKDDIFKEIETSVKKLKKVKSVDASKNKVVLDDNREMKLTKFINKNTIETDFFIVVTHKPIDVVGMSTDKGWKSCTNIRQGEYKLLPFKEVQEGGMIAYLIQGTPREMNKIMDDHKENGLFHQRAVSRIFIRRFEGMTTRKHMVKEDEFIFKPESRCYRVIGKAEYIEDKIDFQKTVNDKLEDSNIKTTSISQFKYKRKGGNYSDSYQKDMDYINTKEINNVSENEQIKIIRKSNLGQAIKHIKKPSENVMLVALKKYIDNIYYLKNMVLTEKVKNYLIKNGPSTYIEYLKEKNITPSEKDINYLIKNAPSTYIKYIKEKNITPSEKVIKNLIKAEYSIFKELKSMFNISKDVEEYAVKVNSYNIRYIEHPSEELQEIALSNSPGVMRFIKDEDLVPRLKKKYEKESKVSNKLTDHLMGMFDK